MSLSATALLLLDIDGVLNPFAAQSIPDGYIAHHLFDGEDPVLVNTHHGDWVRELATAFDVVWVSAWGQDANHLLVPLLELPPLPMVPLPTAPFSATGKVPAVAAFAGNRSVVWIDDALALAGVAASAREWAARRRAATLLVPIDPAVGWTRDHVDQALRWAG